MSTHQTFQSWFNANLKEFAGDISRYGADAGYPYITYTEDCAELFDRFAPDIWGLLVEGTEAVGAGNVAEFIASFRRADMADELNSFKALCLWYACEELAHRCEEN